MIIDLATTCMHAKCDNLYSFLQSLVTTSTKLTCVKFITTKRFREGKNPFSNLMQIYKALITGIRLIDFIFQFTKVRTYAVTHIQHTQCTAGSWSTTWHYQLRRSTTTRAAERCSWARTGRSINSAISLKIDPLGKMEQIPGRPGGVAPIQSTNPGMDKEQPWRGRKRERESARELRWQATSSQLFLVVGFF